MNETDSRPMRDYPCPHCENGRVIEDWIEYRPVTRRCVYCEGRGYFRRPILPRGAVRAFAVLWDVHGWWDDPDAVAIFYATSPAKAKMRALEHIRDWSSEAPRDILTHLLVRRAPEHDGDIAAKHPTKVTK